MGTGLATPADRLTSNPQVAGSNPAGASSQTGLAPAADPRGRPLAVERIIEAVLKPPAPDPLGPIRDAALVAAMGFTVAARPSEWLVSATWADVGERTVELQAVQNQLGEDSDAEVGLKTGARVALLLPNARDRLLAYREALEARHGTAARERARLPGALDRGRCGTRTASRSSGPRTTTSAGRPACWRPARKAAAQAPDTGDWIAALTFYELRHSAISTALHSTLVMTRDGMNLHALAAYAGHDVQTMQRYYAHVIARYRDARPIDLERECARAREQVEAKPFTPPEKPPGPQREAQRRRRARASAARS